MFLCLYLPYPHTELNTFSLDNQPGWSHWKARTDANVDLIPKDNRQMQIITP